MAFDPALERRSRLKCVADRTAGSERRAWRAPAHKKKLQKAQKASAVEKYSSLRTTLSAVALGALGLVGYGVYTSRHEAGNGTGFAAPQPVETTGQRFKCDGRTRCSQMTSCAEAIYFLQHCPNTQMDGNNDGEPCEQQWCN